MKKSHLKYRVKLCVVGLALLELSSFPSYGQEVSEASRSIAGGGPEVLGLRLGMGPKETLDILRQRPIPPNERPYRIGFILLVAENPNGTGRIPVPDGKYVSQISNGETGQNATSTDHDDRVSANFTPTPGNERLAAIYRRLGFASGSKPSIQSLAADLNAKYGVPTATSKTNSGKKYVWAFDGHNNQIRSWGSTSSCYVEFPSPDAYVRQPTSPEVKWTNSLVNWKGKGTYVQACGSRILTVDVTLLPGEQLADSMRLSFLDIASVIDGQREASALIAATRKNAEDKQIHNADRVKSPEL